MKKKFVSVMLAAVLTAGTLAGCGGGQSQAPAAKEETKEAATTEAPAEATAADTKEEAPAAEAAGSYNIGILQLIEHPALDAASQGFQDAFAEKVGAENVTFNLQNAQGEQTNCATIASSFVADNVDLILANATLALQTSQAATQDIPILGTSITDYATALDMTDWDGTTGINVSGTSDLAPLDEQENMLIELFPDAKNVGILYCSAEANSKYQADVFAGYLKDDGIEPTVYTIADTNDIASVCNTIIGDGVEVVYIPTDNTLANATESVNSVLEPAGVPVIAGEEGICSGCGVATLSISYYDLGYRTGEMAYEVLVEGKDIKSLPISFAPNVTKKYMADRCEKLGVTIPDGYEAIQ